MVASIITVFVVASIVLGLVLGGGPERIVAGTMAAMFAIDRVAHALFADYSPTALDLYHLVLDLAGLAAMVAVALTARRYWPLWACSSQLISLFSHLAWLLGTGLPKPVYLVMDIAPSALISCTVILGTAFHQLRLMRRGTDLSCKGS